MTHRVLRHGTSTRSRRAACLAGLAAVIGGCDPGWDYRPVSGSSGPDKDGLYQVPLGGGRIARANASLFGGTLNVEFHVDGLSSGDENALRLSVLDRSGKPLHDTFGSVGPTTCKSSTTTAGKFDCALSADYSMEPAGGCTPNHPGKRITFAVEGSDAGKPLSLRVPMEAE